MKDSLNVIDNITLPYFAYGSNLNGKDWDSFISRNDLKSDSIIVRPGIFFCQITSLILVRIQVPEKAVF